MYDELRALNKKIQHKQERIDELRAALTPMSSPLGVRVQSSSDDRLSRLMCKIVTAENELDILIDKFADLKREAQIEICNLPNEGWQDVLYAHYIEFKPFYKIAEEKGTTEGAIKQKNNRALKYLKKSG